jgi:sensor domain CHASE-containing protein
MNIRQKCAAAIALSLAISAVLNVAVLRFSVFPSFIALENQQAANDIHRVVAGVEAVIADTSVTVNDYSSWDDTHTYALEGGKAYIDDNYAPAAIAHLRLNLVSIHDRNGRLLFDAAYSADAEDLQPAGPLALSVIDPQGALLARSEEGVRNGLLMTAQGPLIVASRPILSSGGTGPFAGTLVMGRILDERMAADLKEATAVTFGLLNVAAPDALDEQASSALGALAAGEQTVIADAGGGTLAVYALLRDIDGEPTLLVRADVARAVSRTGLEALLIAVAGIIAAGLLVLAVTVALLQRLLVGPISQLTSHLVAVGNSGDLSRRVGLERDDEIGLLGRQFDDMLEKLTEARRQLLDQSYSAGLAEMASGVLHNIRNQLAPLSLRLGRLEASLDKTANSKAARAIEELKVPGNSVERTGKLLQFVEMSWKQAEDLQAETIDELKSVAQDFVRIETVLRDLDRFSRSRSAPGEIRLVDLVRETVAMLPKYPDIEVTIRIDPALEACPPVAAEPFVLKHVVQNLLVNAIEAMIAAGKTRGTITISGAVAASGAGPCIDLQIRDEGIGIAADRLEQVFARGYSTKAGEKRGSGLHWCANSMLAMGGAIQAESPGPGQGATMHLIIPASHRPAQEAA